MVPRFAHGCVALCLGVALLAALAPVVQAAHSPDGAVCTIVGTPGDDVLRGTPGNDVICARGGNDRATGRGGADALYGEGGRDRLRGGPGRDWLIGGAGDDRLAGGPGDDRLLGQEGDDWLAGGRGEDSVSQDTLRNDRNFSVGVTANYNVPAGTKVTWRYRPGDDNNCTRNEQQPTSTIDKPGVDQDQIMFTAKAGDSPFEQCAWEKSNAHYVVSFDTPNGNHKEVAVNIQQGSSPNVWIRSFRVDCESQTVPCAGGSDTVMADIGSGVPSPPVHFGPIDDFGPPKRPPSLICGRSFGFRPETPVTNFHVCTADGDPLPTLSYEGSFMPGDSVRASRWPGPTDTWIVLNGEFPKSDKLFGDQWYLYVLASTPNGWSHDEVVTLNVSPFESLTQADLP